MSETVIGFINSVQQIEPRKLEKEVRLITPFGFNFTDEVNLYNYPKSIRSRDDIIQFVISDTNDTNTATILLEEENYDPSSEDENDFQKRFPPVLKDRVLEITKVINYLVNKDFVREIGFSISFCDEIEHIKHCSRESFEDIVVSDCIRSCPSNTLYIIDK